MTLLTGELLTRLASSGGAFIEVDHARITAGYLNPLLAPRADEIVRAVNAHEEAVAVIKALDEHLTEYGDQVGPLTQVLWDRARKLLASLD